jgi:C1A family cysteine protease
METAWEYLKRYGTIPFLTTGTAGDKISCSTVCEMAQGFPHKFDSVYLSTKESLPPAIPLGLQSKALHTNIDKMKENLMKFGPIQGAFSVYQSFYDFFDKHPTGVYFLDPVGEPLGGHTSKIIGWGTLTNEPTSKPNPPKGTEFWILQNTWGKDWGDKGFYRVAMTQARDLPVLTHSDAFVIEYNAMASNLAVSPDVYSLVDNPIKPGKPVAKHLWFWLGLIFTLLILLGLVIWLVSRKKST